MGYCNKCGAEIPEGASFCEKCGNPVGKAPKQGSHKKKWVLAGGFGGIVLAVESTGPSENNEQKSNVEDKVWEAYVAYKAYLKGQEEESEEDVYDYNEQRQFESKSIRELCLDNIDNTKGWDPEEEKTKMAKKAGIEGATWSDMECKDSLEEAYIILQK